MAFWTGNQAQAPQHGKYGTVPGRYYSQVYPDKRHAGDYHQYLHEQPDRVCEPNYWTMPGSRTGGVLQDYTNWTEKGTSQHFPFALESQTRRQGAEKTVPERLEREWLLREAHRAQIERQERERERERARERERERERERVLQSQRWESLSHSQSPVHYRKDGAKRSLSSSSYRELEAWAARYCNSLPRRKRLEAGLWGAAQGVGTTPQTQDWAGRGYGGETYQRPTTTVSPLPYETRDWGNWERPDTHQPPPYKAPPPAVREPGKTSRVYVKENAASLHRKTFSSPPCYIPPPPYSTPQNGSPSATLQHPPARPQVTRENVAVDPAWEQQFRSRQNYCTLPAMRRHDYTVPPQRERCSADDMEGLKWRRGAESHLLYDSSGYQDPPRLKSWDSSTGPQNQLPEMYCQPQSLTQPQVTAPSAGTPPGLQESTKTKPKKRRGGETIFCLVSRMGGLTGLSSSPDDPLKAQSLPLFAVTPHPGVAEAAQSQESPPGSGESPEAPPQLADEVDSGDAAPGSQPSSAISSVPCHSFGQGMDKDQRPKPRGLQHWMDDEKEAAHREELRRAIQRCGSKLQAARRNFNSLPIRRERATEASSKELTKMASSSSLPTRKTDMQPQSDTSVKFPLWRQPKLPSQSKCTTEQQSEKGKDSSEAPAVQDPKINVNNEDEEKQTELNKDLTTDNDNGILVIDATCVVVRVEFIFPPKKEHVQYVCTPPCNPSEAEAAKNDSLVQDPEPVNHSSNSVQDCNDVAESFPSLNDDDILGKGLPVLQKDSETCPSTQFELEPSPGNQSDFEPSPDTQPELETSNINLTDQTEKIQSPDSEPPPSPEVIPEKESLEERTVRILAIPCLEPGSQECYNQIQTENTSSLSQPDTKPEECSECPKESLPADASCLDTDKEDSETTCVEQAEEAVGVPLETEMNGCDDITVQQAHQADEHEEEGFNSFSDPKEDDLSAESDVLIRTSPELKPQVSLESEDQFINESLLPSLAFCLTLAKDCSEGPAQSLSNSVSASTSRSNTPCEYLHEQGSVGHSESSSPPESIIDPECLSESDLLPNTDVIGLLVTPASPTESPDCRFPSPPSTPCVPLSPSISPLPLPTPPPPPPLSPQLLLVTPPPPSNLSTPSSITPPLSISPPPPSSPLPDLSVSPQSLSCASPIQPPIAAPPPSSPFPAPEIPECPESGTLTEVSLPVPSTPPPPVKEEPQCPKSLWDAVHRIRKHTAPDSENEEEEIVESWENPESIGSDAMALGLDEDSLLDHEAWTLQEVTSQYWNTVEDQCPTSDSSSFESGTVREGEIGSFNLIKQSKGCSKRHTEEDTLSCSSSDSHGSRDTVIMGEGEGEDRLSETEAEEGKVEDFTTFSEQTKSLNGEVEAITQTSQRDKNLGGSIDTDLGRTCKTLQQATILASGEEDSKVCVQTYTTDDEELGDPNDKKESCCPLVEESRQPEGVTESQSTQSSDDDTQTAM